VATFHQAGSYTFAVTVSDPGGAAATSDVTVVVNQTASSLTVSPVSVSVVDGHTQQFAATVLDQFGKALTSQPAVTWSLAAGSLGTISSSGLYTAPASGTGSATVTATSATLTGTAIVSVVSQPTYTVTTLADSGSGSLRAAIAWADANPGNDLINFAVTGTIALQSALPALTTNVTIEGPGANLLTIQGSSGTASSGGVFVVSAGASDSICGLTISGGKASYGGGVYNSGTLTISNDMLANNAGTYYGGGVCNVGNLTVIGSTFVGNHAGYYGGGIYAGSGDTTTISNSTFTTNSAGYYGGAVANLYGMLTVTNATIAGNTAVYYAGGIFTYSMGSDVTTLRNTIVAANQATYGMPDIYGSVAAAQSYNNLIGVGSGSNLVNGINGNLVGSSTSPLNPLLGPLQNNGGPTPTMAVLGGSPAINAGNNAYAPGPYDQRGPGYARIVGGTIDIGAYEYQEG